MNWRDIHGGQNLRMAQKMLEQQGEVNQANAELVPLRELARAAKQWRQATRNDLITEEKVAEQVLFAAIDALSTLDALDAEPDYMKAYRRDWADLIEPCGVFNRDQVARELADYSIVMREVAQVYETLTGGALSKPNTAAEHVLIAAERVYAEAYAERLCERADDGHGGDVFIGKFKAALIKLAEEWHPGAWQRYLDGQETVARIRAVFADQTEEPASMPADVVARIDDAIANESTSRRSGMPRLTLVENAGSAGDDLVDAARAVAALAPQPDADVFADLFKVGPGVWSKIVLHGAVQYLGPDGTELLDWIGLHELAAKNSWTITAYVPQVPADD